jgi:hypothetical protein
MALLSRGKLLLKRGLHPPDISLEPIGVAAQQLRGHVVGCAHKVAVLRPALIT